MIYIDHTLIDSDIKSIIEKVKIDLASRGIERFKDIKRGNDNIQCTCPFHNNGQEKKPSFGINVRNGKAHCFACGWSGDLSKFIGDVFHKNRDYGLNWLIKNFTTTQVETRESLVQLSLDRKRNKIAEKDDLVSEEELDSYRYWHPYMGKRGLTMDIAIKFDIGYDEKTNCITFPVYDEKGRCLYVVKRSVESKRYIIPPSAKKPVYALNLVTSKEVYVVESFLNALTLWKYGKQAVALQGTGTKEQYEILKNSSIRTFILAFDPDDAGRKATEKFRKNLGKYKQIKEVIYEEDGKDINDLQENCLKLRIAL